MTNAQPTTEEYGWPDGISALKWATNILNRVGGYARSGVVPASVRGVGVPWSDLEDLALTITGLAAQVQPAQASLVLRAVCNGPDNDPDLFILASRCLQQQELHRRKQCFMRLSSDVQEHIATLALMRVTHATFRPRLRRRPPRGWYAKAAGVKRTTMTRANWLDVTASLEGFGRDWRDMGQRALEQRLKDISLLDEDDVH